MSTVIDKVYARYYATKLIYPTKPRKPFLSAKATAADVRAHADALEIYELDMVSYRAARKDYHADDRALTAQFRKDLEEEYGMTGHPKADLLYSKAYEMGDRDGLAEIVRYYDDLVELVK